MLTEVRLKKLLILLACLTAGSLAQAQVDANYADQAALDGVKGIGPTISRAILDERKRRGRFKDWPDLEQRVPGMGERRSITLSAHGLVVEGKARSDPGRR